ncbi:SIS domain-containing protein [Micromonospora soli]|uniref:SIS domain-containing protein n=1 Tax=Micromonospora sp. NBRC 110009 TaxID=3061627 RepID=UPI002670EA4A|nr:SIS domain-containing protein [Micromonospora sp. NBRC 110009]WKT96938.1 SIS domain-containing protein [Micromonospora sp. NBRC 110009]
MPTYTRRLIELLDRFAETQHDRLDRVAQRCADTLQSGGLVHLFGTGHSVIPTLDAFPRYGSFAGLHPLTDPRLMWHNVLGPGGVRELLWLERTENYIDKFLDHQPLNSGDVLVVYSHGGRNSAGIEAAMYAGDRGIFTVAVTSSESLSRPAEHSSGKRLADVCDEMIDTGAPVEDALMTVDGWDRPVGGSSTVIASVVSHELVTRTATALASRGVVLPTFVSPTVPGAALASNDEVFAAHRARLHAAEARRIES